MTSEFAGTGDKGAHYHRCDFQVHSPRDRQWKGAPRVTEAERLKYRTSAAQIMSRPQPFHT